MLPDAAPNITPRAAKKANETIAKLNSDESKGKREEYVERMSPQELCDVAVKACLNKEEIWA